MEKLFVPYELSLKLIYDLGFNEDTLAWFNLLDDNKIEFSKFYASDDYMNAPLWQQAFDWFAKEKKFFIVIYPDDQQFIENAKEWYFKIVRGNITTNDIIYKSYEEARYGCLEKLIELQ